jgi:hypothetical protein
MSNGVLQASLPIEFSTRVCILLMRVHRRVRSCCSTASSMQLNRRADQAYAATLSPTHLNLTHCFVYLNCRPMPIKCVCISWQQQPVACLLHCHQPGLNMPGQLHCWHSWYRTSSNLRQQRSVECHHGIKLRPNHVPQHHTTGCWEQRSMVNMQQHGSGCHVYRQLRARVCRHSSCGNLRQQRSMEHHYCS